VYRLIRDDALVFAGIDVARRGVNLLGSIYQKVLRAWPKRRVTVIRRSLSHNDAQTQLKNAQDAIARGVAGIVISPTDSSTCPSVLALAQKANIPVVIADIGTNEGEYSRRWELCAPSRRLEERDLS
jgi:Periplasmic binding protein domain